MARETQDRVCSVVKVLSCISKLVMPDIACPFAIEEMKGMNHAMIEFEFDFWFIGHSVM